MILLSYGENSIFYPRNESKTLGAALKLTFYRDFGLIKNIMKLGIEAEYKINDFIVAFVRCYMIGKLRVLPRLDNGCQELDSEELWL